MPMDKLKCVPGYVRRFLFHKSRSASDVIKQVVQLSEKGRRDGVLALESEIGKLDDKFLAQGLKMLVDGTAPETIETSLRMELLSMGERHKAGKKFFDLIKLYAPGYGLVATLIGQIACSATSGARSRSWATCSRSPS